VCAKNSYLAMHVMLIEVQAIAVWSNRFTEFPFVPVSAEYFACFHSLCKRNVLSPLYLINCIEVAHIFYIFCLEILGVLWIHCCERPLSYACYNLRREVNIYIIKGCISCQSFAVVIEEIFVSCNHECWLPKARVVACPWDKGIHTTCCQDSVVSSHIGKRKRMIRDYHHGELN
jgi:hypothetical protein